ncbi:hypothetical protein BpHYR1_009481 [Brachionus plicatilis]|uniref:Uncharacterized protein n=1 Tax=Brachionus plicatilis TaxID=10195 RepID=A0A3M7S0F6_BRAPC|nr:hypothetical protein BpHYR1_009481 [Brachionus plicatilis]
MEITYRQNLGLSGNINKSTQVMALGKADAIINIFHTQFHLKICIKPLSVEDIFRSHSADGRTKETQSISIASLEFARPHINKRRLPLIRDSCSINKQLFKKISCINSFCSIKTDLVLRNLNEYLVTSKGNIQ